MRFRGIPPRSIPTLVAQPMDNGGVVLRNPQGRFIGVLGHSPAIFVSARVWGLNAYRGGDGEGWLLALRPGIQPEALPIDAGQYGWRKVGPVVPRHP
ncbi:protein of unknown function [Magnetospirillum gryphiswaldense MSR-1 v2]|uniref:Uncharacterized protein n=1 Tax=Magnetospirillum gryphiswaldense (strain DSM 6361 / JCM 21280 / NBRC 15271 / MSR-1) TaxID=431944 RepID=V6F7J8_MAGGM|nr:hypothetical protein [Magnetospirillum gryphiswaldense]CDL00271.1 protein of unknown function [Magnetospirillum gryphiswaldense MSR-1 v2]